MKKINVLLISVLFYFSINAQSLRSEIESYNNYENRLIENARNLLSSSIEKNDSIKIKQLYIFLNDTVEGKNYALTNYEQYGMAYITGNYTYLLSNFDTVQKKDNKKYYNYKKFYYYNDDLDEFIQNYLFQNSSKIKDNIKSQIDEKEKKDFLLLNLDYLNSINSNNFLIQDSLNIKSRSFFESYPKSLFNTYVKKEINKEYEILWRLDWYVGFGYSWTTGFINSNFGNTGTLILGANSSYKKINLNLDFAITGNTLEKDILFNDTSWSKGKSYNRFHVFSNLGYNIYNKNLFFLTPQCGLGYVSYYPPEIVINENPKIKGVKFSSIGMSLGLMADFGFCNKKVIPYVRNRNSIGAGYWNIKAMYNLIYLPSLDGKISHVLTFSFGRRGYIAPKKYKE